MSFNSPFTLPAPVLPPVIPPPGSTIPGASPYNGLMCWRAQFALLSTGQTRSFYGNPPYVAIPLNFKLTLLRPNGDLRAMGLVLFAMSFNKLDASGNPLVDGAGSGCLLDPSPADPLERGGHLFSMLFTGNLNGPGVVNISTSIKFVPPFVGVNSFILKPVVQGVLVASNTPGYTGYADPLSAYVDFRRSGGSSGIMRTKPTYLAAVTAPAQQSFQFKLNAQGKLV